MTFRPVELVLDEINDKWVHGDPFEVDPTAKTEPYQLAYVYGARHGFMVKASRCRREFSDLTLQAFYQRGFEKAKEITRKQKDA